MNKLEEEIQNDQELFSYFRDRNTMLCQDNFNFLMEHPEIKRLLNDYLSNILLHKPDDVFKFTKDYFKFLCDFGESHKLVVLVGPNSVGKTTMIDYILKQFPDNFVKPDFRSTIRNEDGFKKIDVEEEKTKFDEKFDETKEKFEEKKEKGKNIADNVINDLYTSIDEFKEYIKNMQKSADQKYADYKKSTVQTIDIDLIETKDIYYIKAAVPGVEKEDILIEAGDNDLSIETTFKPFIEEFEEGSTSAINEYMNIHSIHF